MLRLSLMASIIGGGAVACLSYPEHSRDSVIPVTIACFGCVTLVALTPPFRAGGLIAATALPCLSIVGSDKIHGPIAVLAYYGFPHDGTPERFWLLGLAGETALIAVLSAWVWSGCRVPFWAWHSLAAAIVARYLTMFTAFYGYSGTVLFVVALSLVWLVRHEIKRSGRAVGTDPRF